jgi:PadR family transcriptional regulator PadR
MERLSQILSGTRGVAASKWHHQLLCIDRYLAMPQIGSVRGESAENWTTQLRKGVLELCILNSLSGRRRYGYEIVRTLSEVESLVVGEGTIYPILNRFKREALVRTTIEESPDGPARKYYELTDKGRKQLRWMNEQWEQLLRGIQNLRKELS